MKGREARSRLELAEGIKAETEFRDKQSHLVAIIEGEKISDDPTFDMERRRVKEPPVNVNG